MRLLNSKAIQPREESDEELEPQNSDQLSSRSDITDENISDRASQSSIDPSEGGEEEDLKDITFGALAEAQARLAPNPRKRKLADRDEPAADQQEHRERVLQRDPRVRESQEQHVSRSSKHAPTIMSSRNPVSRRREIFSPPPAEKSRDPRFDAAVTADARRGNTSSTQRATQNYAFLNEYQAVEISNLKTQLKKAKDPAQQAELKRKIMSTEAKLRNAETRRREAEILQEHKKQERQAIKDGKKSKPYYLKQSDVMRQISEERQAAMGKRAKDKSEKRKKKREKTKDARDMPRVRRIIG